MKIYFEFIRKLEDDLAEVEGLQDDPESLCEQLNSELRGGGAGELPLIYSHLDGDGFYHITAVVEADDTEIVSAVETAKSTGYLYGSWAWGDAPWVQSHHLDFAKHHLKSKTDVFFKAFA